MKRNRVRAAIRRHFEAGGFVEVETSALQVSPGNEAHLHGIAARLESIDGRAAELFLHTSPEFACKKLLAAGETRIFTLAPVYRNRERGPLHHPEFTMLEWYRTGETYQVLMDDCGALLALAAEATGAAAFTWRGRTADPFAVPERLTVAEAFARHAGIDLMATLPGGEPDTARLRDQVLGLGLRIAPDDSWSDLFSRVLSDRIEPRLGRGRATILTDYPACEAALARRKASDPRVSERFELYVCGIELANAFGELTDPQEQRRRFEAEMAEKERVYGRSYPIDEDFIAAVGEMPAASGAALGFDRLAMLAAGAERIDQVIWAPVADPFG